MRSTLGRKKLSEKIKVALKNQDSEALLKIAAELPDEEPVRNIITGQPTTIGHIRRAARASAQRLAKAFPAT